MKPEKYIREMTAEEFVETYEGLIFAKEVTPAHMFKMLKIGLIRDIDIDDAGNMLILNQNANAKTLLVAHADNVQKPREISDIIIDKHDCIYTLGSGAGWDDKAGVLICAEIFNTNADVDVLITQEEETGMIGAKAVSSLWLEKYDSIVEFDFDGVGDYVHYGLAGDEIISVATSLGLEYAKDREICSDISVLNSSAQKINLSCGSYNPHKENEFLCMDEFKESIETGIKFVNELAIMELPRVKRPLPASYPVRTVSNNYWGGAKCDCCGEWKDDAKWSQEWSMMMCEDCKSQYS